MTETSNTTIRLFGSCRSGNCMKPRWIAEKLGLDYEWIEVDVASGETRTEDFLAINPSGQVPVAVFPDGHVLGQSNAIMLYLAGEGDSELVPSEPFARAKMMEWMFWEQYSHEPYIAVRRADRLLGRHRTEEEDQKLLANGRRALARMDMALLQNDFLVGDSLTLADVALVAYTRLAHEGGFELADFPRVKSWIARVETALSLTPALQGTPP